MFVYLGLKKKKKKKKKTVDEDIERKQGGQMEGKTYL